MQHAIPIKFNLRCQTITMTRTAEGVHKAAYLWVFHSFKRRQQGIVSAADRNQAKRKILELHPEAEFYR